MKSLILAMDVTQWILIAFIVLLVIAYPILVSSRNKKENQKMQEQTNSLKRGDKVLTTSGVYGTIVDLEMADDKKVVTIETGSGKYKSYLAVDAYAIYSVMKDEAKEPTANPAPKVEVKEAPKAKAEPKAEEKPAESAETAPAVEAKPKTTRKKKAE